MSPLAWEEKRQQNDLDGIRPRDTRRKAGQRICTRVTGTGPGWPSRTNQLGGLSTPTAAQTWNEPRLVTGQLTEVLSFPRWWETTRRSPTRWALCICLKSQYFPEISSNQRSGVSLSGGGRAGAPWEPKRLEVTVCTGGEGGPWERQRPSVSDACGKAPHIQEEDCRAVTGDTHQTSHRAKDGAYTHQPEQKTLKYKKGGKSLQRAVLRSGVT